MVIHIFVTATAEELIDGQYVERPHLRPVCDAIIAAAARCGALVIQARKTYVSLVTARRTFDRVQPTAKNGCSLGFSWMAAGPAGGGAPRQSTTMRLQVALKASGDVDAEVEDGLRQAYEENC